jgi:hypothetical protein
MTPRLWFWLRAMDLAHALRLPHRVYLWTVCKASDATDWGEAR